MITDHLSTPPTEGERRQPMQRVRVGVTGLAAVVLFMALATAIATGVRRNASAERAATPIGGNAAVSMDNAIDPTAEPLAQLGVAPGANGKNLENPAEKRPAN